MPPSAQAGKEVTFVVRITNIGTESWRSGEHFVFVKIYDVDKNYLTETDKIRQLEDTDKSEALTAKIAFDIPPDYAGLHYYKVGIEFEKEILFSHYFTLRISPFAVPKEKKYSGTVQLEYQDNESIEPTAKLKLRLVNRLGQNEHLGFSASAQATSLTRPEINNFLISHHSKKLHIAVGDFSTGLSPLTLGRSRGIKIESRLARMDLGALAGSSKKTFEFDLYGLSGSINLTDNLDFAANYVRASKNHSSITSVQGGLVLTPEITLTGEYAWSNNNGQEIEPESEKGNAFRLFTSLYSEKLSLDVFYEKAGKNFCFLGNPSGTGDYEEYDVSLSPLIEHVDATISYNTYHSGLSQTTDVLVTTTTSGDLSITHPNLPLLLLTYSLDKTYEKENENLLIDDALDILAIGISQPMGRIKLLANYLKSAYKDNSEPVIYETNVSTDYGFSVPWGKRTTASAKYAISSIEDLISDDKTYSRSIILGTRHGLTLGRTAFSLRYELTIPQLQRRNKATTSWGVTYSLNDDSALSANYTLTNSGLLVNPDKLIGDRFYVNLSYQHRFTKNHKLKFSYYLENKRNLAATDNLILTQDSTLRLVSTYNF